MSQRLATALGLLLALLLLAFALRVSFFGDPTYSGEGDVVSVDAAALQVTISHDDIPDLMPAMTMPFSVSSAARLSELSPGTRIRFTLVRRGGDLQLTGATPIGAAGAARPGVHDHTPHHGGVVSMWGMTHIEVAATPDGWVRIYPSDVWRRPLSPAGWTGSVTLDMPGGTETLTLAAQGEALEAHGPPLAVPAVFAHVRLMHDGPPIEMHALLPLRPDTTGASLALDPQCRPPEPSSRGTRRPRCTIAFGLPLTVLAATGDGTTLVVAAMNAGVTAWRTPAGVLSHGFAPPPPVTVSAQHPPHGEAANAVAMRPDGTAALVALDRQLLLYDTRSGQLLRELSRSGGVLRALAWSPDGAAALVSAFGDRSAHMLDATDGHVLRELATEDDTAAVAVSPDGRFAAVGTEAGPIAVFDMHTAEPPVYLRESRQPVENLVFAAGALISAGAQSTVWEWEPATGALRRQFTLAAPALRLAVTSDGRYLAIAGRDWVIRIHDLATGEPVEELHWHRAAVYALAWAGPVLASGDNEGRLALWDLPDLASIHRSEPTDAH
jgi:Cu/Ag efflux protein CusF